MFKKHKRRISEGGEAGFTLVELVVVIVLAAILGTFGFQMLTDSLLAQRNVQVRKEHSDDAVLAMNTLQREVMEATAVTIAGTMLTLTPPNALPNIVYSLGGTSLIRDDGSENVIAQNVTSFTPSVMANGSIRVRLTFNGETGNREIKVFRRN
ncbi:MAG: prepilin-type N-terminal cleavage/methylation domain-containing protein [Planctomycetota bacterium]